MLFYLYFATVRNCRLDVSLRARQSIQSLMYVMSFFWFIFV